MYIQRRAFDDLPPDAIVLSEEDVLRNLYDIIYKWKDKNEVWAILYGPPALGLYNVLTVSNVGFYFKNRLKLPNTGRITFFMVTAGLTGLLSFCLHYMLGVFSVYGVGGSAFTTAVAANTMNTYPIDGFQNWSQIKGTTTRYKQFTKQIMPRLAVFATFGAILTCALVKKQYTQFHSLNQKLYENDRKLREVAAEMRTKKPNKSEG